MKNAIKTTFAVLLFIYSYQSQAQDEFDIAVCNAFQERQQREECLRDLQTTLPADEAKSDQNDSRNNDQKTHKDVNSFLEIDPVKDSKPWPPGANKRGI